MAQTLPLGEPSQLPRATRRALRGADVGHRREGLFERVVVLVVFEVCLARREQRHVASDATVQQAARRDERPPAVPGREAVRAVWRGVSRALRMQGRHTASAQPQPQWSRPRPQPQPRPRPQPQPRPQARTSQALLGRWATQGYPRAVLRRSCARYAGGRRAHTRAHAARLHAGSVSTQVLTRGATAGCTASRAQHCRPTLHVRRGEWAALARLNGSTACRSPGLGGGGAPWSERVEQPRPNAVPCTFQALQHAGRAGEAAQDAAGHRGADDKGEVASEVAVVLRDEAAVLEAGVQLHCEVLGEDERLGGRQDRYDRPARNI